MPDVISLAAIADHIHALAAAVPNPGQGEEPPGAEQLTTILRWVAWTVRFIQKPE